MRSMTAALLITFVGVLYYGVWAVDTPAIISREMDDSGFEVTVEIPKAHYAPIERIDISITLTNRSEKETYFVLTNAYRQADIRLFYKEARKPVPRTLFGEKNRFDGPSYRTILNKIPPRGQYVFECNLNRLFDLTVVSEYLLSCRLMYLDSEKKSHFVQVADIGFNIAYPSQP